MTFYTSSVSTSIIDPVYHQSARRDEFRMTKDGLHLTNMRIHNLGLIGSDIAYENEANYNYLAGCHGAISNIYLYDGKTILDQVLNYNVRSAFTEYNKTNSTNQDIAKLGSKTGMGFVINREPQLQDDPLVAQKKELVTGFYPNVATEIGTEQDTSPLGFLNLQSVFPLLKNLQFIHTGIFKNLRVVIEYKKSTDALSGENINTFAGTALPILVVDTVNDEALSKKFLSEFKGVQWSAQEVEQVYLAPNATKTKFRLNGFADKTLMSVLIQKSATTSVSKLYKALGSETCVDEEIQLVINGANLFPQSIDRPMMRLDLLTQTLGNCNSHTLSSSITTYFPQNVVAGVTKLIDDTEVEYATFDDRCGRLDYFGCVVNKKVTSIELSYSRNCDDNVADRYKQGLYINVWGNVTKVIVPSKNGGYAVQYL